MLLSRETDYALRILSNLLDGERRSAGEISGAENIPRQFAYKIIKKLSKAGLVEITRGVEGGCRLVADLEKVSLYDLMAATDDRCAVNACMAPDFVCPRRQAHGQCAIHGRIALLQQQLDEQLRACSLYALLTGG